MKIGSYMNTYNSPVDNSAKAAQTATALTNNANDLKLKNACQDMEAVFLNLLMSQMRSTVVQSDLLGNRQRENMLRSMLDSEMTKDLAKAGGIGLADMLYRQLSRQQSTVDKGQAAK